jgi:hypothetical protein
MKVFDLMTGGDEEKVNHPTSSSTSSCSSHANPLLNARKMNLSQKLQVHNGSSCHMS